MKKIVLILLLSVYGITYSQVPITGRKYQITLIPQFYMNSSGEECYRDFLRKNPPLSNANAMLIKKVGKKIADATTKYLKENGYTDLAKANTWEFNLVEDKTVNAWSLPGGKIAFYTGILPYTKDENGIAVVMAHEIAHNIAQHGNERMSKALIAMAGEEILKYFIGGMDNSTKNILLQSYGIGSSLGLLAYSRENEYEADKLGMAFMAMAGYNPEHALAFWQTMSQIENKKTNEYLSTHPSDANRVKEIKAFMPEAKKYYKP